MIKFRAWLTCEKRMVPWSDDFFSDMSPVTGYCSSFPDEDDKDVRLMQFTGMHDKKGIGIYEGDILDFDEKEWGGKFKPEIVPSLTTIAMYGMKGTSTDVSKYRTVIGNIYDNE